MQIFTQILGKHNYDFWKDIFDTGKSPDGMSQVLTQPINFIEMIKSILHIRETKITTKEIREKYPRVFDSKDGGHSCNATFLFMMYEYLDLTKNGIEGRGVSNHPLGI